MLDVRRTTERLVFALVLLGLLGPPSVAGSVPADTTQPAPTLPAVAPEAGQIPTRYLNPDEYGGSPENWDAAQDSSGVFYVANTDGLLIYDGHSWRTLPVDNRTKVRSVAADEEGRIFVGAGQEFGAVRTDDRGRYHYVSLLDRVPEEHRSFNDVWEVVAGDEGVYFRANRRLFRWDPDDEALRVWRPPPEGAFRSLDRVRDSIFVNVRHDERGGLMTIQTDALRPVPGGETFAERPVKFVAPRGEQGLFVVTLSGVFVREGASFRPFRTEADALLEAAWVYRGTGLPDGTIVIHTIDRGLLLLEQDGTVRRSLAARDKPVTGVYRDREGGLWALLDGGLLRYDLGAPFTEHGTDTGLEATGVVDVARHRGTLYAATNQSAYRLRPSDDTLATFERVRGLAPESMTRIECFTLLSDGRDLLVGTSNGLARRGGDGSIEYLFPDVPVYDLLRSRVDSSRLYAATANGVRLLTRTESGWTDTETYLPGLSVKPRSLAEADDGALWVGTPHRGVYRARSPLRPDSVVVDTFGTEHGLPDGPVRVARWQGRTIFGTSTDLKRFRPSPTPRFVPLESVELPPLRPRGGDAVVTLEADGQGHAWGYTQAGPGRWTQRDSAWRWAPGPLVRFDGDRVESVEMETGGAPIWFGVGRGELLRYVPGSGGARAVPPTSIHRVALSESDSLLAIDDGAEPPQVPAQSNGVRFSYGTPSLIQSGDVEYQYRLAGQHGDWSDWTPRTEQAYRALAPGSYRFAVRARTAYGDTTATARYSFTVLPPWYRTWWAYGFYLLTAVGVVAGAVRARTWQLRRRQEELAATVEERTREIEAQKERLAEQAQRLEELDEAKSRFFANVSHEFRTPLTLIQGPVREVRRHLQRGTGEPEEDAEQLSLVERNTRRLLRLVDQLLGIARLDAGSYELSARPTDLGTELQRVARAFEPMAEREGLTLTVETDDAPPDAAPVYVDREALEHVLSNLLSNAIKFTPAGGTITITGRETPDAAAITVADTGPGIPEDERDAIFDRFEQVDDTSTRAQEGAGIGLAFAADLVDLHGGRIDLDSTEGEGTSITVHFRRGTVPLSEEQIAEAPVSDRSDGSPAPEASAGEGTAALREEAAAPGAPAATGAAPEASDGAPDASTGKRVLVVDDNEEVRRYVRSILAPGFVVMEASDGEEGLQKAREALPDVILADVMMPSVDGHEMTRRLKADPETEAIPVIMVTARVGTDEEVEGLQAGADDYVTKPFDADVLRQRVEGVVALQERLRDRLREEMGEEAASPDDTPERSEIEREARQVIREHITDPDLAAASLAEKMGMSRTSLYRAFDEQTDTTPSALITQVRMERATELLRDGEGTVTQVAYAVGYDTLSGFSRAFRKHVGQSPSAVTADR